MPPSLDIPSQFPVLPPPIDNVAWPASLQEAYGTLRRSYLYAYQVIELDEVDPLRLRYHLDKVEAHLLPILSAIEQDHRESQLVQDWLQLGAQALGHLLHGLDGAIRGVEGREESHIARIEAVTAIHTGHAGRPRKELDKQFLETALSAKRNISLSRLARTVGVHRHTVRRYMRLYGLDRNFADISDEELDLVVKTYRECKPKSGIRYLIGFLRSHGLRIPKTRLHMSLQRVDQLGRVLRQRQAIRRRQYKSSRPNALWHCDGHHKLIHWGIVIHGFIDGFCRTVTALRASSNNTASTVLQVFLDAVEQYGVPSRVRGDRGGENIEVSVWMILRNGPNRASFMWGSSMRNTRIERLWVEVGRQFCRQWRGFFQRLERLHCLDRDNPHHLWLLHILFLPIINNDCTSFKEEWNAHPISGPDTGDRSPNDLRTIGQATHGIYVDDGADLDPDILHRFYGTTSTSVRRSHGQTGAGHAPEEDPGSDEEDEEDRQRQVTENQEHHVRHDPVDVPAHHLPFQNDKDADIFFDGLRMLESNTWIPEGYGVLPTEMDDGYEVQEIIKLGKRGRKELVVDLPEHIWRPRTEQWARALCIMNQILFDELEDI